MDDDDDHFVSKYATLEEVEGKVAEVAQDQNGCRFLQKKFDEGGPAAISMVFAVSWGGVSAAAVAGLQLPPRAKSECSSECSHRLVRPLRAAVLASL
jgi:hypothetical protein